MRMARAVLVVVIVLLVAMPVVAHVPSFQDDNTSPGRAVDVSDPTKSWVFYDTLGPGQAAYYRVTLSLGERLRVGTFTPVSGEFTPSMVVMSSAFPAAESVPAGVVVPDELGAIVVAGNRSRAASYEPFTPAALYQTARFEQEATARTTYLIAIYDPANRSGPVGVAVGTEERFATTDLVSLPFDLVRIHRWAGQPFVVVVGPLLLTILAGLVVGRRRWQADWTHKPIRLLLGGAGVLILGSGVSTAVQMTIALSRTGLTPAALLTAVFAVVPIVSGSVVVWLALRPGFALTTGLRVGLAAAGVVAFLTWAGFVVGPLTLVSIAVLPRRLVS